MTSFKFILIIIILIFTRQTSFAVSTAKDLLAMVETEREFSATAVKLGFRDSFIKYFAEDGIGFGPEPQLTKSILSTTPPSTGPRQVIFKWQPLFCDISLGGDMGYTTGPIVYEDVSGKRPPSHGMYFSVWQKQGDGSWKVVVDMGTSSPQAVAPIDTKYEIARNPNGISESKAKKLQKDDFLTLDADFSAEISKSGLISGYNSRSSDELRLHRNFLLPIINRADLIKYLEKENTKISFKQKGGKISKLRDFAFTYGNTHNDANETPSGYYVHVWRKNKKGNWKLVADIFNELPKSKN